MTPSFFNGTGLSWGTASLCAMVNLSRPLAEDMAIRFLDTWITERDFYEISKLGFNSIRLPIGYWNIIRDPYALYAPADYRVSIKYIDWCFNMAEKYNLSILVDIHGGPGSQNGIDHSGCGFSIVGQPQWTKAENIRLNLRAIDAVMDRYSDRSSFIGGSAHMRVIVCLCFLAVGYLTHTKSTPDFHSAFHFAFD